MVPFTAWHTTEMDSAQKNQIETINEVLFLKNAYRSLSRAIFQMLVLTMSKCWLEWRILHDHIIPEIYALPS